MSAPINQSQRSAPLAMAAALLVLLAISFAPLLGELWRVWDSNPQYSHGFLVPVFSVVLLWLRRGSLRVERLRPSWWGVGCLAACLALRHAAAYYYLGWFEQLSLVACVASVAMSVGGVEALRWSWPSIAFLGFMIPLPYSLEVAMRDPLRGIGTRASTFVMQTVGLPAFAEGNVIVVGETRIGVVEACSGLRMLMVFFALSTAVAVVAKRPMWERLLIVASAVPIAVIANVVRITLTGVLYALKFDSGAHALHDHAELLMMPLALGLHWIELWFLGRLVVVDSVEPFAPALGGLAFRKADAATVRSPVAGGRTT